MNARKQIVRFGSITKAALVLVVPALGLVWALLAGPALAAGLPTGDQYVHLGCDAVALKYIEYENGSAEVQLGFSCELEITGMMDYPRGAGGLCLYRLVTGWTVGDALPRHEGSDDSITWVVIASEPVDESQSRLQAVAKILYDLTFSGTQYNPVLAFEWQWAAIPGGGDYPGAQYHVVGTTQGCWCACIPDAVPDCGKPYVPFSVGPVTGTYHNGGAWGGPGYTNETQAPPNQLFGINASLNTPQLFWSRHASGLDVYTFRHGAMRTQTFAGIPDIPDPPQGTRTFPDIINANGSALHWTYASATSEHMLTSKSRATMHFADSGSEGYQKLSRVVAANGVDKLYYKWDGDRPAAIYSNKVAGRAYKTCINYNANGHISSIDEKVVEVSGDWPYTEGDELWSRTTTVGYTTIGGKEYINTINHPGNLTTTFGYDGDKLTRVTYPYGHSQHFVYTGNKVTEYYEDGATLKNNYRTYTYNAEADYDELSPWKIFHTGVAHRKADGTILSRTRRYHDGWRLRGHSADVRAPGTSTPLMAASRTTAGKHGSGGMIEGVKYGSGPEDDFFLKSVASRTEHGSPTKVYARVFSSAGGGNADDSETYVRASMEYARPDSDVPHFETLTKLKTYVGRETHAAYYTGAGDDSSFKYNLKEIHLNDNDSKKVVYDYYGDSDGDDAGLLKKVTSFDGTKAEYEYDARRILKVYAWPSSGNRKQVLEYKYNGDGNGVEDTGIPYDAVTAITDVNGKTTTFDYDVIGRVTSVTIPADGQGGSAQTWQYAYAANADHYNALKVTVTRPDAKSVVYQYNPNGTLDSVDAPDVGSDEMVTVFDYDNHGRLLTLTDADSNVTLWSYDAAGRVLTETIEGDGAATNITTYGYNPDGQIAHISDPLGQTFDYTYDDDNRLSSILMKDAQQNQTTKTIQYSWNDDAKTQLWTVSVGSDSVEIRYNEYGLLDYVDGVLDGNADKVSYQYDDDYRLEKLKYYIDTGQGLSQVDVDYSYDTFGRLESIEDRLGLETEYAYNDDHTLKSLTLPNGTVTDYTYDDLRRLVSIATTGLSANDIIVKFTYHYNDLGLRDNVTMADGRTIEWDYDDVGRLVEEHFKSAGPSPTTLLRYVYTYDAAGNRTSKKTDYDDNDGNGYAATATYTNNGYNQLTAVSGSPGRGTKVNVTGTIPTAWTLADADVQVTPNGGTAVDAEVRGRFFIARNVPLDSKADNSIVASTSATTLADHSPSSDTVLNVGLDQNIMWSFSYNANGDLTERLETVHNSAVQWSYCYSTDGWLTKATKIVDGQTEFTEQYWYDPIGRKYKIATTQDAQTTTRYFVYDGGSIVLELEEDSGDYLLEKEHVRGASLGGGIGGLLYTRRSDGSIGYFHYDGRGSVVSITDDSREEVAYYEYDAWGNALTACGSLANEFRFSTKQASLGTGLIDVGYRWYDPQTGRWTQRDPIGTRGGTNPYGYAGNSPIVLGDAYGALEEKFGHFTFKAIAGDHDCHFHVLDKAGKTIGKFSAKSIGNVGFDKEVLDWASKNGLTDELYDALYKWTPRWSCWLKGEMQTFGREVAEDLVSQMKKSHLYKKAVRRRLRRKIAKRILKKFGGPAVLIVCAGLAYAETGNVNEAMKTLTNADMIEAAAQLVDVAMNALGDWISKSILPDVVAEVLQTRENMLDAMDEDPSLQDYDRR